MKRFFVYFVLISFVASCGKPSPLPGSKTIEELIPSGFSVSAQRNTENSNQFVIAQKDHNFAILIVKQDGNGFKVVKESAVFSAKLVSFAPEELWPVKLSNNAIGYPLSFELNNDGDFENNFIKVFDNNCAEIPNDLGPGFVPRDFQDFDLNGVVELVCIDARWVSLKQLTIAQPFTQKICVFRDGIFKDETSGFIEHLKAGEKTFSQALADSVTQEEILYNALNLLLIYESMGRFVEGIAGFKETLRHIKDYKLCNKTTELLDLFGQQALNGKRIAPPGIFEENSLAWEQIVWNK